MRTLILILSIPVLMGCVRPMERVHPEIQQIKDKPLAEQPKCVTLGVQKTANTAVVLQQCGKTIFVGIAVLTTPQKAGSDAFKILSSIFGPNFKLVPMGMSDTGKVKLLFFVIQREEQ